jgi:hypothetical protein
LQQLRAGWCRMRNHGSEEWSFKNLRPQAERIGWGSTSCGELGGFFADEPCFLGVAIRFG